MAYNLCMPDRSNFDHYVAQHYIKLFTDSGGEAHVVDVVQKTVARYTDFSQIMGRRNWSIAQSIEDGFTRLENDIAGALRRLNQDPTAIRGLAASTCVGLRNYICMHAARAVGVHEALNQTNVQFQHEMRRVAHRLAPPSFDPNSISFPEVNREASLHHGIIVGDLMSVALQMRGCIAVIAPDDYVFVLGEIGRAHV